MTLAGTASCGELSVHALGVQFVQSKPVAAVADPDPPLLLDTIAVFVNVVPHAALVVLLITCALRLVPAAIVVGLKTRL